MREALTITVYHYDKKTFDKKTRVSPTPFSSRTRFSNFAGQETRVILISHTVCSQSVWDTDGQSPGKRFKKTETLTQKIGLLIKTMDCKSNVNGVNPGHPNPGHPNPGLPYSRNTSTTHKGCLEGPPGTLPELAWAPHMRPPGRITTVPVSRDSVTRAARCKRARRDARSA